MEGLDGEGEQVNVRHRAEEGGRGDGEDRRREATEGAAAPGVGGRADLGSARLGEGAPAAQRYLLRGVSWGSRSGDGS